MRDPPAGALGLLDVLHEYACGVLGPREGARGGAVGAGLRSIHVSALPAEPCLAEATIDDIADLPDCLAGLYPVRLLNV